MLLCWRVSLPGLSCAVCLFCLCVFFFFSSRRRHTRSTRDWSSDVCSSDLRQEMNFTWKSLEAAETALHRIRGEISKFHPPAGGSNDKLLIGCAEFEQRFKDEIGRASCRERV